MAIIIKHLALFLCIISAFPTTEGDPCHPTGEDCKDGALTRFQNAMVSSARIGNPTSKDIPTNISLHDLEDLQESPIIALLVARDTARFQNQFQANIANLMSVLLAANILAVAQSGKQVEQLCNGVNHDRLAIILNETLLNQLLCAKKDLDQYLPVELSSIPEVLSNWWTGLWLQQTYVAFPNEYATLCKIFSEKWAASVGLNGQLIKDALCK
ncbi:hypothetical protein FQN57_002822 [Myotisia sp. PD_48]|nr:hypothetical protein FQN57_002822 [Myotisia sp. PD_48]